MAILVDQPLWTFRGEKWSHLVSDTSHRDLHEFANRLGIRRVGFQGDHYDLPARLVDAAIDAGAVSVDSRVLVRRLREAGLRKPSSYQTWTAVLRRDGTDAAQAQELVATALRSSEASQVLRDACSPLWAAMIDSGASLHQLLVLHRPKQWAVAFDTDPQVDLEQVVAAGDATPPHGANPEMWITRGNPRVAIDVLWTAVDDDA